MFDVVTITFASAGGGGIISEIKSQVETGGTDAPAGSFLFNNNNYLELAFTI